MSFLAQNASAAETSTVGGVGGGAGLGATVAGADVTEVGLVVGAEVEGSGVVGVDVVGDADGCIQLHLGCWLQHCVGQRS